MKASQIFKSELETLVICKDCFRLASNSFINHMVVRYKAGQIQMSHTFAEPNIYSPWLTDEGSSQKVDNSQHLKPLLPLVFQFSWLSNLVQKQ